MKKPELYSISHKGEVLFDNLTEEEYFDKMQDLADDFYANGTRHPLELNTDVKNNGKNIQHGQYNRNPPEKNSSRKGKTLKILGNIP